MAGFSGSKTIRFEDFKNMKVVGDSYIANSRGIVVYGDYKIHTDKIKYEKKAKNILLTGNVLVKGEGLTFKTDFIKFNLGSELGETGYIDGYFENEENPIPYESKILQEEVIEKKKFFLYIQAKRALLTRNSFDKPSFVLEKVKVTDCEHDDPHHNMSVHKLVYSSEDKIELSHLVLRIFGLPYFYWPYVVKDIRHDWPWTRWEIGSQADWGRYAKFQTHLMPETFDEKMKFGLDYRMRRGRAYHINYDKEKEGYFQNLGFHFYDERWEDQDGNLHFEDQRFKVDLEHRQELNTNWSFRVDAHYNSPTEEFLWIDGTNKIKSRNRFLPPVVGAKQDRDGVLEEYEEFKYLEGPIEEQEVAFEYWKGNHYMQIGSTFSSDQEQVLNREKWIEIDGRNLPSTTFGLSTLYSNEYKFGKGGQRIGQSISTADQTYVLGSTPIRDNFQSVRGYFDQTIETDGIKNSYFQLTPFFGSRSLIYEKSLKPGFEGQGFWETDDSELEEWSHSHRFKSGLELATRLNGLLSSGKYQHTLRPSVKFTYLTPTGFDMDRVVAPVDEIDLQKIGTLENRYSLDQEIFKERNGKLSPYYISSLQWRQIFEEKDRLEIYGNNNLEAEDLTLSQSYYPHQNFNVSLDAGMNTFIGQFPTLRAGLGYTNENFRAQYFWNKIKDFSLANSLETQRHDILLFYQTKKDYFELGVSWDEDPNQNIVINNSLYESGFRRFQMIWGHLYHCLRSEIEMSYDFEGGGTSLILKFGPALFNRNLPETRFPLKGL